MTLEARIRDAYTRAKDCIERGDVPAWILAMDEVIALKAQRAPEYVAMLDQARLERARAS